MSKDYKVTQAFRSTVSKTDKTQKTWNSDNGTFYLWQAKVNEFPGWFQLRKKDEASTINPGDTIYGDFVQGSWPDGKPRLDFKPASKPFASNQNPVGPDVLARLSKLEDAVFGTTEKAAPDFDPSETSEEPVDLSEIDY